MPDTGNQPFTRPLCRYEVSVTSGRITVSQNCAELDVAQGVLDRFKARERDNRDAFGSIYDRQSVAVVAGSYWRGGAPFKRLVSSPAEIFAKLAQRAVEGRGAPVSIITDRRFIDIERRDAARGREAA